MADGSSRPPAWRPRWHRPDRGSGESFRTRTFSSLRTRNYRLFFYGQLVSVSGTWMQTIAQAALVLQLTGSGTDLGLTTGARFAPILLFGPWGGLVADRLDKRRVLFVTQVASGVLALAFGILVATGDISLWSVYLLAGLLGLVNVFDNPARQTIVSELVERDQLRNAVTLNSITFNMARVFGAGLGGSAAALLGLALCFDLNALSFVAVLVSLAMIRPSQMSRAQSDSSEKGQIRAGLRYVRTTPQLLVPLSMIAIVGALAWEFQVTLPLIAHNTFHGGPGLYGVLTAVMGAGAVVGGLVTASRGPSHASALATTAFGWGAAITLAGLAPSLWAECVLMVFVGYGSITFNSLAKTSLQLAAAPEMRGRVMALWALAWQGTTPIGGPIVGWIAEHVGARASLLAGGLPTMVVAVLAWPTLRAIDRAASRVQAVCAPDTAAL